MKKVLKILTLIMLILTILKITDTYAKYFTRVTGTTTPEIGQWIITLNDIDLAGNGETLEFELNADNVDTGDNVMPGKIAPGSQWNAELILDPAGTDVAIRYDVTVDPSDFAVIDTQYEITSENRTLTRTGQHTYTGVITLAEVQASQKEKIICSLVWNDNGNNDTEDTEMGKEYGVQLEMPLKLTCVQYLGETLTPYT